MFIRLHTKKADPIEKSEGSKGGQVIGHTKSGKPVYKKKNAMSEKNYLSQDHKDAAYLHLDHAIGHTKDFHVDEFDRHMASAKHKQATE